MNEAFIHMLATLYNVSIVIFSDAKFGPRKYLQMMLYEPGLKEQSEIFLRDLKELLAQEPAPYCIHYARTAPAHFSLMKVQPDAAFHSRTPLMLTTHRAAGSAPAESARHQQRRGIRLCSPPMRTDLGVGRCVWLGIASAYALVETSKNVETVETVETVGTMKIC